MSLVSPSQSAPGEVITAAKVNDPVNQLAAGINSINDAQIVDVAGTKITDATITSAKMATAANPETRFTDSFFDHVSSGCVWSGDSYASSLAASMTAGIVYVGGKRISLSAVTARAFTASKDTYIDVDSNGTISYTEVANNAASPALAANSLRLAIIVSGATIAAVGSVNQGQESKVLPIASSIPYQVTDSLGNLICPRDPNRKLLGFRQLTTTFGTSSTSATDATGLSVPVIVPTGRKVRLSGGFGTVATTSGTNAFNITLNETVTQWDTTRGNLVNTYTVATPRTAAVLSPSAGLHTYKVQVFNDVATNIDYNASTTRPAFVMVELY